MDAGKIIVHLQYTWDFISFWLAYVMFVLPVGVGNHI